MLSAEVIVADFCDLQLTANPDLSLGYLSDLQDAQQKEQSRAA